MKKIYIIYDERARVLDLYDCTVLLTTQDKPEALNYAYKNNGVVEECDFDGKTACVGVIIN